MSDEKPQKVRFLGMEFDSIKAPLPPWSRRDTIGLLICAGIITVILLWNVLGATRWPAVLTRYQIASIGTGTFVRLDTRTGEMDLLEIDWDAAKRRDIIRLISSTRER